MKRQFIITEVTERQDGLDVFTYQANREELKPGAVMLTREEVMTALLYTYANNRERQYVIDELFGKQEGEHDVPKT